jgi:hypothetical protein
MSKTRRTEPRAWGSGKLRQSFFKARTAGANTVVRARKPGKSQYYEVCIIAGLGFHPFRVSRIITSISSTKTLKIVLFMVLWPIVETYFSWDIPGGIPGNRFERLRYLRSLWYCCFCFFWLWLYSRRHGRSAELGYIKSHKSSFQPIRPLDSPCHQVGPINYVIAICPSVVVSCPRP